MVIIINNRELIIDDLINISKKTIYTQVLKKDIFYMWKDKIDYLDKYYNNIYNIDIYDFNYFRGLADISLSIVKNIDSSNITYGISINRFYDIDTVYDLYNPINIKYAPIINTFSEYIKYEFFYNKRVVDYYKIFDLNLTNSDYYYFISRLIFPTYYFDLFKNKKINNNYNIIINKMGDYLEYIKEIIKSIKKRHINMPLIDYIINLL